MASSIGLRSAASPSMSTSPASTIPTSVESKDNDTSIIRFTNVQDLFDAVDCTTGDFLTITHVSPSQFAEIEHEREKQRRKFRFRRYHSGHQILLITIPTDLHEALHYGIYQAYRDQLVRSGREMTWKTIGSATRRAQQDYPGGNGGQGDSAGGPIPDRDGKDAWPSLVIEAGVSESLAELHNDMRWWFSVSDHQVQIVVLAKFEHVGQVITLEKWEEEAYSTRLGATATRHAATLQPVRRQTITITQDATTNPPTYHVTRGALILGFRLLFLRDPGPGEGDFVISVQKLEDYAKHAWSQL